MTIPIIVDAEDPTTQVAWPASRRSQDNLTNGSSSETINHVHRTNGPASIGSHNSRKKRLSTWNLITLSISMAGSQIAWTVELGYD
jgi:solute carrier family 45 protein 1/2/4